MDYVSRLFRRSVPKAQDTRPKAIRPEVIVAKPFALAIDLEYRRNYADYLASQARKAVA